MLVIAFITQYALACNLNDLDLTLWARKRVEALGNCSSLSAGSHGIDYQVPSVKLILYHSDEHEMLADFLQYHSYVFGFKNIVVIDQDSQMEPVCRTLALFQHCGIDVITTQDSFLHKGETLTKVMHRHKHTFLIPLDTDELILPFSGDSRKVEINRDALWTAFKKLPIDGRKYKFEFYTEAVPRNVTCEKTIPRMTDEYRRAVSNTQFYPLYPAGPTSKTFFHSHGFIRTDDGNHFGAVKHDQGKHFNHPDVVNNMSAYYVNVHAQMVHFPVGSYRGAKDKFVRAFTHMKFTGDTNCSVSRVNSHYCVPGKLFINGTDHGIQYYMNSCRTIANAYSHPVVSDWFRKNTMSMMQLAEVRDLHGTPV